MPDDSVARRTMPPDGGWGWIVCAAFAVVNIVTVPLVTHFGIVLQDVMSEVSATEASTVVHLHHCFGMLYSLCNARLLPRHGYRKTAVGGVVLTCLGILLTAGVDGTCGFVVTYSLLTSIGACMTTSAFTLALNSFFAKWHTKARDVVALFGAVGAVAMPFLMAALMTELGNKLAIMTLSAMSMNSLIAACLLRPVKQYLKAPAVAKVEEKTNGAAKSGIAQRMLTGDPYNISESGEFLSENENDYLDTGTDDDRLRISVEDNMDKATSISCTEVNNISRPYKWWQSRSIEINLQSSLDIFNLRSAHQSLNAIEQEEQVERNPEPHTEPNESKAKKTTLGQRVSQLSMGSRTEDCKLLNVILGVSLAQCAEVSFSVLMPFMLRDLGLDIGELVTVLAVLSGVDHFYRFASPFIAEWCSKSARMMLYVSLCMLIFTRIVFMLARSYEAAVVAAVGLGIARGVYTVHVTDVIPSRVPLDYVYVVSCVHVTIAAALITIAGPVLGNLRDTRGTYKIPIVVINSITAVAVIIWSIEFVVTRMKSCNRGNSNRR